MRQDYYKLLGLRPDTSVSDIRHAHHRLSMRLAQRVEEGDTRAKAELTHLDDAYATLSDDSRRLQYDAAIEGQRGVGPRLSAKLMADMFMRRSSVAAAIDFEKASSAPSVRSEDLDWSGWHQRRFSLRPGQMTLSLAIAAAFVIDALYILLIVIGTGSDNANRVVLPLFLLSTVALPLVAQTKGRHWFLWGVIGFAAGTTLPLVFFGRPMSHVAFAAVLLARPGKPRCPHCDKRTERHTTQCAKCQMDLRAQPL